MLQQALSITYGKSPRSQDSKYQFHVYGYLQTNAQSELGHQAEPRDQATMASATSSTAKYQKSNLLPPPQN